MNGKPFTPEEKVYLQQQYPTTNVKDVADVLNRSVRSVYYMAFKLGLHKDNKAFRKIMHDVAMSQSAESKWVKSQFKKGHIPRNKGKKRDEFLSPDAQLKCQKTQFKKGHTPKNYRPVGSERVNVYGYVEIKVADPNKWCVKHRIVWEASNGAIPKGMNIQFRDGNRQNTSLDNLYMISRQDQVATENSIHKRLPAEIKELIYINNGIKHRITRIKKNNYVKNRTF